MSDLFRRLSELSEFRVETLRHIVDILLVAMVIYQILALVRTTRAWRILVGIAMFVLALGLSNWLQLYTLHWILDKATLLAPVALVILLLPELRQAIEGIAKLGWWSERVLLSDEQTDENTVEEVVKAVAEMAASRIGALIVFERNMQLSDIAASGVRLDAKVTAPLLGSVFYGTNPLHDGALIIRGDKVVAAACRLPVSESSTLAQNYHLRHRAGLGITEQSDCVTVVVSEERGSISVAIDGQLNRLADHTELRTLLNKEIRGMQEQAPKPKRRRKAKGGAK